MENGGLDWRSQIIILILASNLAIGIFVLVMLKGTVKEK